MNCLQANTMSIHELIRHLNHGQRQGDGTTMIVGRHAVTEAIRRLNLLGETNEALAACQSEGAAWKRLAEESERVLGIAAAAIEERCSGLTGDPLQPIADLIENHYRGRVRASSASRPSKGNYTRSCPSGEPHIPYCDDPTQCMVCGATTTIKHAPECSYWDGLMAQVCNCGVSDQTLPQCRHSSVKIVTQGESARCLDCGTVISLKLRATSTVTVKP